MRRKCLVHAGGRLCTKPLRFAKEEDIHVGMELSGLHFPAATDEDAMSQSSGDGPDEPDADDFDCDDRPVKPVLTKGYLCGLEGSHGAFASNAGAELMRHAFLRPKLCKILSSL